VCNDRRATVQKVDMTGNTPKAVYSINPTAWQFWAWTAGRIVAVIVVGWAGITFVADRAFDARLEKFHGVAQPQIHTYIDQKVDAHAKLPAHGVVLNEIAAVKIRNAASDQRWVDLNKTLSEMKAQNVEMNKKIDRLLERQ